MNEVKDFVKQTRPVMLQCGKEITVETPTLRWWYEFLIPKLSAAKWQAMKPEDQSRLIAEMKAGALSEATMQQAFSAPPMAQMILAIIVYYVERSLGEGHCQEWVLDNLDINDGLAVINAWLSVIDVKKAMRFFVQINRQAPVAEILASPMGMKA